MADPVIERNTPVFYDPTGVVLRRNENNIIVAQLYVRVLNQDGDAIDRDNRSASLTDGERQVFLSWLLDKLETYESITGLVRWTGE